MSTDKTCDAAWAIQLAYHDRRGTVPPTTVDAETEAALRDVMGSDAVDAMLSAGLERGA